MRLVSAISLGVGVIMALAACTVGGEPAPSDDVLPLDEFDETVTVEALQSIEGAERVVFEGFGADIPPGATTTQRQFTDEVSQLQVRSGEREGGDFALTVTRMDAVSDSDVFLHLKTTRAQMSPELYRDVRQVSADWAAFPYALGLVGEVDQGDGFRPFIMVISRDDDSRLITAFALAPEGALEDSPGYQALRTVRVDGD